MPMTCLKWRPSVHNKTKDILVSVNADGSIIHWHVPSGKPLHRMQEQNQNSIMCLDFNEDGSQFVTGGKDFHIRVYDDDTKSVITEFGPADWNQIGHSNRVFSCKFISNDVLISGGWDCNVILWDLRQKKHIGCIYGPSISGDSLDYKNGVILTGSYKNENQIQLWDLKTLKLIHNLKWDSNQSISNQSYVYSTCFSKGNNDYILAGSSGINEIKLFRNNPQYEILAGIKDVKSCIYSVDFANLSNQFAFCTADGRVYIYDM